MVYLPKEIISRIYEFDSTYHSEYKKVIKELDYKLPTFIYYTKSKYVSVCVYKHDDMMCHSSTLQPSKCYLAILRSDDYYLYKNRIYVFFDEQF